jgi:hypothetical protein
VPHGILRVSNIILYENEFQNPQIFQQTISLFPKHSTLLSSKKLTKRAKNLLYTKLLDKGSDRVEQERLRELDINVPRSP